MTVFSCVVGCLLFDYSLEYVENVKFDIISCLFLVLLLMPMGTHLKTILTNKHLHPQAKPLLGLELPSVCFTTVVLPFQVLHSKLDPI